MTPERRDELRRAEDAVKHARYTLDRKNYMITIAGQDERIKALESLLAESRDEFLWVSCLDRELTGYEMTQIRQLLKRINAILPKTEEVK